MKMDLKNKILCVKKYIIFVAEHHSNVLPIVMDMWNRFIDGKRDFQLVNEPHRISMVIHNISHFSYLEQNCIGIFNNMLHHLLFPICNDFNIYLKHIIDIPEKYSNKCSSLKIQKTGIM